MEKYLETVRSQEIGVSYQLSVISSLFTGRLRRAFGNTEKLPTSPHPGKTFSVNPNYSRSSDKG
ncbi:MAG: hypothetical protein ACKPJK_27180 [Microcystis panniformis]